ncbi:GIY-YIG nuclease family protein [Butyricicoccus pullicaecorum]|uniref:GIY-YIG nuclease family protein n=1 Tax=Butyricicoccus pullicaecorum TaxID=501571 RepID=UPI0039909BDC
MEYVYILECADGTLYTGWTNDLTARLAAHNSGRGAKYTRGRAPVKLAFSEVFDDRSEALGYEAALKKLTRTEKLNLIAGRRAADGEYLTILDAQGRACGDQPRTVVHRQGLRHAVVHLWVLETQYGVPGVWLQRRALDRPLYPGRYDQAATGHIGAGEQPCEAIVREAREECGLVVEPDDLTMLDAPCHQRYVRPDGGLDDEMAYVFLYDRKPGQAFAPGSEVIGMRWVSLAAFGHTLETGEPLIWPDGEALDVDGLACYHPAEWKAVKRWLTGQRG